MIALLLAIGFLAGSIPFGYLLGKARGIDIRTMGSGNIGATNVGRVLGRGVGITCFALDLLKGFIPTFAAGMALGLAGRWPSASSAQWWWIAIALMPIAGHVFCPWLGFKGGKGVATGLGTLLGLYPVMTLASAAAFLIWILVVATRRLVSLGSVVASMMLPVLVGLEFWALSASGRIPAPSALSAALPFGLLALGLASFACYTHRANIGRLRRGAEPRIGERKPPSSAA